MVWFLWTFVHYFVGVVKGRNPINKRPLISRRLPSELGPCTEEQGGENYPNEETSEDLQVRSKALTKSCTAEVCNGLHPPLVAIWAPKLPPREPSRVDAL